MESMDKNTGQEILRALDRIIKLLEGMQPQIMLSTGLPYQQQDVPICNCHEKGISPDVIYCPIHG